MLGCSAILDPTCPETAFQCDNCNNYKEINYNHGHNSTTLIYFGTEKRLCEVYDMEAILCSCSKGLHLTGCNNFPYLESKRVCGVNADNNNNNVHFPKQWAFDRARFCFSWCPSRLCSGLLVCLLG